MTIMVPGKQEADPLSPEPELSGIPANPIQNPQTSTDEIFPHFFYKQLGVNSRYQSVFYTNWNKKP